MRARYDRDFETAVSRGLLSPAQAMQRGNRRVFATRLARRFGLSLEQAFQVADNRIRLADAIRETQERSAAFRIGGGKADTTGLRRLLALGALVGAVILLAALRGGTGISDEGLLSPIPTGHVASPGVAAAPTAPIPQQQNPGPPAHSGTVAIERDELERVTRVSAGHPREALEAVCRLASTNGECHWMELRDTTPRQPGRRLGRFIDAGEFGESWTVLIRRDRASGRWTVGTGLGPVRPVLEKGDGRSASTVARTAAADADDR